MKITPRFRVSWLCIWTKACVLAVLLVLLHVNPAAGAPPEVQVAWEDLSALLENRDIETVLLNGVHIKGKVQRVLPEAIEVKVKYSADPNVVPEGLQKLDRKLFSVLTVKWKKGSAGRVLLTATMPFVTFFFVNGVLRVGVDAMGTKGLYGVLIGGGVLGYYLGDRVDTKKLIVRIRKNATAENISTDK